MVDRLLVLKLGDFDLNQKEEIGLGDFSKILSVPWKGTRVAVKILHNASIDVKEAQMLSRISHKRIVEFIGIVNFEGRNCIVTELAHFGSLAGILYKPETPEFLTDDLCFDWTLDIAKGLSYLHNDLEPGISHGNLKSSNVLIFARKPEQRTVAKICDFGLSRSLEQSTCVNNLGSLYWSAPEILNWDALSLQSDVWSFGATLVEIFTRQKPYAHLDENINVLQKVRETTLTPLHNLSEAHLSKFPPTLVNLLKMCFKGDRTERITMRDAMLYLESTRS